MFSLHKIIVSLLFIFSPVKAFAGDPFRFPAGAESSGMGSVCIAKNGFWSSFRNQALLARNNSISAGALYENRFGIAELGTGCAGIKIPAGSASLGLIYSHFGFHGYSREGAGIACGLPLSEKIAAGVQIDYFSEKTYGEYKNERLITFEAGIILMASENTTLSVHIFNPVPDSWRDVTMASDITSGIGIKLSNVLFAGAEAEMISGQKALLRTGFEYEIAGKLWLRGGFCTENSSFSFGLGYLLRNVRLDISFASHERLGITSGISLVYKIR